MQLNHTSPVVSRKAVVDAVVSSGDSSGTCITEWGLATLSLAVGRIFHADFATYLPWAL